jgi:hypothetical protein
VDVGRTLVCRDAVAKFAPDISDLHTSVNCLLAVLSSSALTETKTPVGRKELVAEFD